jgi:hypothetical protein
MTEQYLLGLIPRIRADRVELYCHPARPVPGELPSGLDDRGERELAALLSRRVKDSLARSGFVLSGTAEPR